MNCIFLYSSHVNRSRQWPKLCSPQMMSTVSWYKPYFATGTNHTSDTLGNVTKRWLCQYGDWMTTRNILQHLIQTDACSTTYGNLHNIMTKMWQYINNASICMRYIRQRDTLSIWGIGDKKCKGSYLNYCMQTKWTSDFLSGEFMFQCFPRWQRFLRYCVTQTLGETLNHRNQASILSGTMWVWRSSWEWPEGYYSMGVVAKVSNPSTGELELGGSLQIWTQLGRHQEVQTNQGNAVRLVS